MFSMIQKIILILDYKKYWFLLISTGVERIIESFKLFVTLIWALAWILVEKVGKYEKESGQEKCTVNEKREGLGKYAAF